MRDGSVPRLALVLGAGGFRGRASLGVLRRLRAESIPIDSIVGVSAGALIAGYHAGVGWDADECIAQVSRLGSRMLLAYGVSHSRIPLLARLAWPSAEPVRRWVELLDAASFDRLHHGLRAIGVLAYDLNSKKVVLFATGQENDGVTISQAVRASAAVPFLLGPVRIRGREHEYRLLDGGVADAMPVSVAFAPPFSADFVLAVDITRDPRPGLRRLMPGLREDRSERLIVVRPRVASGGTIFTRRGSVRWQVRAGEECVTPEVIAQLRGWLRVPA